ncbi:Pentatricopeptide repeat-containing protein [Camellia lanceoleosa]|uniref:Pentatricopeptide repeat-containing protein n=1 Tax=Camellia lanceoleosa TaxID=1840588 RepID=A0ACC0HMJ7_9ERIC|nr:Pentatricopeptide repeat-containing protein [Camellia lanceoleosa]
MIAYETYFRSLCSAGRLDEAEALSKKMMKKRTVLEICVYGSFIEALFWAGWGEGNVDDALRIFNEIVTSSGLVYCVDICNHILGGYWKVGRVADAEKFFDQLQDGCFVVPNLSTYKTMVVDIAKKNQWVNELKKRYLHDWNVAIWELHISYGKLATWRPGTKVCSGLKEIFYGKLIYMLGNK